MVVVLAIPLAGWFGWREWRSARLRHNHFEAHRVLFQLAHLVAAFRKDDIDNNRDSGYWTGDVAGLLAANSTRDPGWGWDRIARADPSRTEAEPHNGYWFVPLDLDADGAPYRVNGKPRHPSAFAFCAYPADPGRSGQLVFLINEEKQIYMNWDVRVRPKRWPNPTTLRMQWSKAG